MATAGPAAAGDGFTSLSCSPGTAGGSPSLSCTVTPTGGPLHFVRITDISEGHFVASAVSPCGTGAIANPQTLTFPADPGDRYRVVITSCTGGKDVFRVTSDGQVTLIKAG
ncbi:MAG: hypothetical protein V7605_35 [Acidimicrobiaceae bacterium]